jgi:hypothetical protein
MSKSIICLKIAVILFIACIIYFLYRGLVEQSATLTSLYIVLLAWNILNYRDLVQLEKLEKLSEILRNRRINEIESV